MYFSYVVLAISLLIVLTSPCYNSSLSDHRREKRETVMLGGKRIKAVHASYFCPLHWIPAIARLSVAVQTGSRTDHELY